MTLKTISTCLLAAILGVSLPASATAQDQAVDPAAHGQAADSAEIVAVIDDFHAALARGDSARVTALLTPDARILEGGGIETVEEYTSGHLAADMAFASAVDRERGPLTVTVRGDVAWAFSTNRAVGTYREREIDSRGAELVVLSRTPEGWRIEAVHWSS